MRVILVGYGNMGRALLGGWLETGLASEDVRIVEPFPGATAPPTGTALIPALTEIEPDFDPDIVVFAVKPQAIDEILPPYARYAASGKTTFLSIAAGTTIAKLSEGLGADAAIIRAMPNTPAAIQRGITVLTATEKVSESAREACTHLLSAVGEVAWIDDEALMDAVTALSGSGPAYIFLLAECMAEAGEAAGLPATLAQLLADATVAGAGEMLRLSSDSAARLRENVTSPGGTTEAALSILMANDGLQPLLTRAIKRATDRSRELAG